MRYPSWKWYWLAVAATAGAVALYVDRRDLQGRYEDYLQTQDAIRARAAEVAALEAQVETIRQRVRDLEADPVAQEAAIRRWSGKVREGETVYRIALPEETAPAAPEPEPPAADAEEP